MPWLAAANGRDDLRLIRQNEQVAPQAVDRRNFGNDGNWGRERNGSIEGRSLGKLPFVDLAVKCPLPTPLQPFRSFSLRRMTTR